MTQAQKTRPIRSRRDLRRRRLRSRRRRPVGAAPTRALPATPDAGPFDLDRLRDMVAGNEAKLRHHLRTFVDVTGGMVRELQAAVDLGDLEEVRRLAHKTKGASGMVGAGTLTEVAAALERRAVDGAPGELEEDAEHLARAFEAAREFAETY